MDRYSEAHSPDDDEGIGEVDARKLANRACDFCHRMKMKCIGKETPPCNRCKQSGQSCTFDGPRKSKSSKVEDRLRTVEGQMGTMQSALEELVRLQRSVMGLQSGSSGGYGSFPLQQQSPFTHTPQTALPPEQFHLDPMLYTAGRQPANNFSQPAFPTPSRPPFPQLWSRPTISQGPPISRSRLGSPANPSSAPMSDDEDADPLRPGAVGPWDNMFHLAEAARLEQDGHVEKDVRRPSKIGPLEYQGNLTPQRPVKRARTKGSKEEEQFAALKRTLPVEKGDHVHSFKDAVELGYCTLEKARECYDLFMDGCLVYMPCFDPEVDTFESVRRRSPFLITAMVMVISKILDAGAGQPPSILQQQCREHAEKIGMSTLFTPIARIEVVQALIILASWGDTSWRPGGHALRMAMDMGLYRCLPMLMKGGMGRGKGMDELREEWPLVVGARVWLTLYKLEFEMAFNLGRPALFAGEETIQHARDFLLHPLAVQNDSRLVSTCELLTGRLPLHQPFSLLATTACIQDLDAKLREHEILIEDWRAYWDAYHEARGVSKGSFLRESLITASCSALMYADSRILHSVKSRRDVESMPEERRQRLFKAVKAAETMMSMCLRSQSYTKNFRLANIYTHLNIAFAARFVIRMSSLVPGAVNSRQIGRDVEKVANILTQVPGFQFAQSLRDVINRARRNHVLPPPSKPPSPIRHNQPLLPMSASTDNTTPVFNFNTPNTSSSGLEAPLFDFGYAEQLFAEPGNGNPFSFDIEGDGTGPAGQGYALDTWFPFPPLETDATIVSPTQGLSTSMDQAGSGQGNSLAPQGWW